MCKFLKFQDLYVKPSSLISFPSPYHHRDQAVCLATKPSLNSNRSH